MFGLGKLDCGQLIKEVLNTHTSARAVKESSSIMVMAIGIGERSPKREKNIAAAAHLPIEELDNCSFTCDFKQLLG